MLKEEREREDVHVVPMALGTKFRVKRLNLLSAAISNRDCGNSNPEVSSENVRRTKKLGTSFKIAGVFPLLM